tara:strand:+ start:3253 stop:3777 length:525 start_codon:yes stop_codon:yes gene_type:complete
MTSRIITSEYERRMFAKLLEGQKLPFTASMVSGKTRSWLQNKLQRKWCDEVAEQLDGWESEETRAYCKLRFGIPIRRRDDVAFCEVYDKHVKHLPYETKLALMALPLDFPVTRDMKTGQKTEYLDAVFRHFTEQGVILTIPDDARNASQAARPAGGVAPPSPTSPATYSTERTG